MISTILFAVVGALLVLAAVADVLLTTVRAGRAAGPLTQRLTSGLWRLALRSRPGAGPPRGTGPVFTLAVLTVWLTLLLAGWFLVFSASRAAVVSLSTSRPADPWSRLHYVAFTVSTLGTADYVPSGAVWQVLTGIAAITAFGLATLVITYVASLNSAVADKRQFARHVFGLGADPVEILRSSRSGRDLRLLDDQLISLTRDLHSMAEHQLTYPLLHYFTTRDRTAPDWPATPGVVLGRGAQDFGAAGARSARVNATATGQPSSLTVATRSARPAICPCNNSRPSQPSSVSISTDAGITMYGRKMVGASGLRDMVSSGKTASAAPPMAVNRSWAGPYRVTGSAAIARPQNPDMPRATRAARRTAYRPAAVTIWLSELSANPVVMIHSLCPEPASTLMVCAIGS